MDCNHAVLSIICVVSHHNMVAQAVTAALFWGLAELDGITKTCRNSAALEQG